MKIKILKTGKVSLHPAWGPAVPLTEDQTLVLAQFVKVCAKVDTNPLDAMKRLVKIGYAKELTDEEVPEDEENNEENDEENDEEGEEGIEPDPLKIVDIEKHLRSLMEKTEEDDHKQIIQDWGMLNCNHKVAKSKTVDNMIAELVEIGFPE